MIELVKLEDNWKEFAKQNVQVVVISVEDQPTAQKTQEQFPHLIVVADAQHKLCDAISLMHRHAGPDGEDIATPTTLLVDGTGKVRWFFRPNSVIERLPPVDLLAAIAREMPQK